MEAVSICIVREFGEAVDVELQSSNAIVLIRLCIRRAFIFVVERLYLLAVSAILNWTESWAPYPTSSGSEHMGLYRLVRLLQVWNEHVNDARDEARELVRRQCRQLRNGLGSCSSRSIPMRKDMDSWMPAGLQNNVPLSRALAWPSSPAKRLLRANPLAYFRQSLRRFCNHMFLPEGRWSLKFTAEAEE